MVDSSVRNTISSTIDQYSATIEKAMELYSKTYDVLNTNKSSLTGQDATFIERFNKLNTEFTSKINSHGNLTPSSA